MSDNAAMIAALRGQPQEDVMPFGVGGPAEPSVGTAQTELVTNALRGLAGIPKRAIDAASEDVQHLGDHSYSPKSIGPALETAVTMMGGAGVVPAEANSLRMGIKAYHGSPHDFDAFSTAKIGTGEGAQAYGHGLYFAENPSTAQSYRDSLSKGRINFGGQSYLTPAEAAQSVGNIPYTIGYPLQHALTAIKNTGASVDAALRSMRYNYPHFPPEHVNEAERLLRTNNPHTISNGKMYEVDINADPKNMLNFNKPLDKQNVWEKLHPEVREAVDSYVDYTGQNPVSFAPEAYTGHDLHTLLKHDEVHEALPAEVGNSSWYTGATTHAKHVAEYLKSLDVPGIQYLDAASRRAGQGTNNYVMFNDNLIKILKKYGIAAPGAAGAAAAVAGSDGEKQ